MMFAAGLIPSLCRAQAVLTVTDTKQLKAELGKQAVASMADRRAISLLSDISEYKKLAFENLLLVQTVQGKVHQALTEVNSGLRQGKMVIDCYTIIKDIVEYQVMVAEYAKGDPVLLLFAEKSAKDFQGRSKDLILYITDFVSKSNKEVLMDTGKRDELISYIRRELRLLRALAYSAQKQMYWASVGSKLELLNPWQGYVDQDKKLVRDILRDTKFVK